MVEEKRRVEQFRFEYVPEHLVDVGRPLAYILFGVVDAHVKKVKIITQESNFINNMKTVYRESEDRFPGVDRTREYRRGLID